MKSLGLVCTSIIAWGALLTSLAAGNDPMEPIIFATFAEDANSLNNVLLMARSIRTFGGRHKDAPIRAYMPRELKETEPEAVAKLKSQKVEVSFSEAPDDALWFYYARKVFAAAKAEADARDEASILAWLDEDTIVLSEPDEFVLPADRVLGYRPVMHKNIGLLYDEPIDEFWGRAFELIGVDGTSVFPMVTVADSDTIKPYFNAGCVVLRPQHGLMAKWAECFRPLYQDSLLTEMCKADVKKRIFIHQVALAGAILRHLERDQLVEFSERINYPIFFEQMFGAKRVFDDITRVVTFRHESYFRKPAPDWEGKLKGPADRIAWIKEHLDTRTEE